jgi:hypothetical protein
VVTVDGLRRSLILISEICQFRTQEGCYEVFLEQVKQTMLEVRSCPSPELTSVDIFHYIAAEQRITPWEDDASVPKCPLCACVVPPIVDAQS